MATFNIIGCCVSRDILGFMPYSAHKTLRFLQFSTPASYLLYHDKPPKLLTVEELNERLGGVIGNFIEKCIVNDYNKNFLDYYDEKSDYFIIDFATLVRDGLVKQTLEDGTIHYFTNSSKHRARNKVGRNVIEVLPGKKEYISSKEILQHENIVLIVDRFCAWLEEKGYKPKQLILVEVKHARYYSDEKRLIEFKDWEQLEWENRTLDEINRLFLARYPQCHFIRFPDGYYGGLRHRWGLFSLHYCDEVYDYLYDMVNMITERGEITEEAERQVRSKYANRIQNNVKQLNQFSSTVDKLELNYQQERRKAFTYSILLKQQVSAMLEQGEKVAELHSKPILYGMIHAARVGWTARQWEHETLGDVHGLKQIEAVRIGLSDGDIHYAVRVNGKWQQEVSNYEIAGTVGKSMPVTGIRIYTTASVSVSYQIYDAKKGWKNGKDGDELTIEDSSCITAIRFWVNV